MSLRGLLGGFGMLLLTLRTAALEAVNSDRATHDLAPLALDPRLSTAAQSHADDMAARGYYDHRSPEGATVADRYAAAGGEDGGIVAENIARCDGCAQLAKPEIIERLERGWMDSPSHRANILAPGLELFGFGLATAPDGTLFAVQTFAGPGQPATEGPAAAAVVEAPAAQTAVALEEIGEARREAGAPPLTASDPLVAAAEGSLPASGGSRLELPDVEPLLQGLAEESPARWRHLAGLGGQCSGCGAVPTEADIAHFVQRWLEDQEHRATLLDPRLTALGLALRADGKGRKVVLALLAGEG